MAAKAVQNYGRTLSFSPRRVTTPASVGELETLVRGARRVRAMGARHSWSAGIVTDDVLVSLDSMKNVLHVDRDKLQVRVQAGIRLTALIAELERHGLALENLGSIATQSLAGAISTGTHGTGLAFQCLAGQVQSLALIDGRGERRAIDRDHPDFPAVVVGLGAFGIVYEMTLSVVPTYQMHAITETMPFDDLLANLDELVRGHDHFKFWWLVGEDKVIVFRQNRTSAPRNDSDFTRWLKDDVVAGAAYRAMLALQKIDRDRMVRLTNRVVGQAYGKRFERICKSHVAFLTPEPPVHRESEWAFDYSNAVELLREYRDLLLGCGHSFSFIQEIRFTAADDFWASPSYGRDSIWLSLYNIDKSARWDDQLATFLRFVSKHDARPHWGKEANFDGAEMRACFPRFDEFAKVRESYDPGAKFANPWIRGVFSL
jgi:FAD/FMN-containing dehydrogenase